MNAQDFAAKVEPGDAICVDTLNRNPLEVAIDDFEGAKVNHVICPIGNGLIVEALGRGVEVHRLDKYLKPGFKLYLRSPKATLDRDEMVRHLIELIDTPYGFLDLLLDAIYLTAQRLGLRKVQNLITRLAVKVKGQIDCSGTYALAYSKTHGHWIVSKPPEITTPADILNSDSMFTVATYGREKW